VIRYYPEGNNNWNGSTMTLNLMKLISYSKVLAHGMVEIFYEAGGVF
jgi:hypothetical protein